MNSFSVKRKYSKDEAEFIDRIYLLTCDAIEEDVIKQEFPHYGDDLKTILNQYRYFDITDLAINHPRISEFLEIYIKKDHGRYIKVFFNEEGYNKVKICQEEYNIPLDVKRPENMFHIPKKLVGLFDERFYPKYVEGRIALVKLLAQTYDARYPSMSININKLDVHVKENYLNLNNFSGFIQKYFPNSGKLKNIMNRYCFEEINFDSATQCLKLNKNPEIFESELRKQEGVRQRLLQKIDDELQEMHEMAGMRGARPRTYNSNTAVARIQNRECGKISRCRRSSDSSGEEDQRYNIHALPPMNEQVQDLYETESMLDLEIPNEKMKSSATSESGSIIKTPPLLTEADCLISDYEIYIDESERSPKQSRGPTQIASSPMFLKKWSPPVKNPPQTVTFQSFSRPMAPNQKTHFMSPQLRLNPLRPDGFFKFPSSNPASRSSSRPSVRNPVETSPLLKEADISIADYEIYIDESERSPKQSPGPTQIASSPVFSTKWSPPVKNPPQTVTFQSFSRPMSLNQKANFESPQPHLNPLRSNGFSKFPSSNPAFRSSFRPQIRDPVEPRPSIRNPIKVDFRHFRPFVDLPPSDEEREPTLSRRPPATQPRRNMVSDLQPNYHLVPENVFSDSD